MRRFLVVLVLRMLRVVVRYVVCDRWRLAILLIVENRLTNLHIWNRLLVNNWSQRFETGVLNMTNIVLVNRDFLMVHSVFEFRRGMMIEYNVVMKRANSDRGRFLFRAAAAGNTKDDEYERYDEEY